MIASVGVVAPAVSKDQRRLAQQLMRLRVSFPDLCNELSESINELSESIRGTVSDVSACVTDSSKAGFCRAAAIEGKTFACRNAAEDSKKCSGTSGHSAIQMPPFRSLD
jgi:hypothetical protein